MKEDDVETFSVTSFDVTQAMAKVFASQLNETVALLPSVERLSLKAISKHFL